MATAQKNQMKFGSNEYFLNCALGGLVACGLTHTAVTPLDSVKCRIQADPTLYKGIGDGFKKIIGAGGVKAVLQGWTPTLFGYCSQGAVKFGLYEYFKVKYSQIAGPEVSKKYKTYLYLSASMSAEFFADLALCPFEALKVKIQTQSDVYGKKMLPLAGRLIRENGFGSFYKGIVPLWCRQIPYTAVKFTTFEKTVETIYSILPKKKEEYGPTAQLGVTFLGGYIAGVFCAVVSHPADTLLSKMSKNPGKSAGQILSEIGMKGVWAGLGPRIVMIGTLTGAQWLVYDAFKKWRNMPAPKSH